MWHTPEGDRRLTGAESELVRQSLATLADRLSTNLDYGDGEDRIWDFGVTMFDELAADQQLVVIRQVAEHLLRETPDTLELTAVNEAATYAIFANVGIEIEIEVDMAKNPDGLDLERTYWRQLVLSAYAEANSDAEGSSVSDEESSLLPPDSDVVADWQCLIESLADRVLWDRDFEMGDIFLDTDPAKASTMKQALGIKTDYYTAIAEEARERDTATLLESVRKIAR